MEEQEQIFMVKPVALAVPVVPAAVAAEQEVVVARDMVAVALPETVVDQHQAGARHLLTEVQEEQMISALITALRSLPVVSAAVVQVVMAAAAAAAIQAERAGLIPAAIRGQMQSAVAAALSIQVSIKQIQQRLTLAMVPLQYNTLLPAFA